MSSLISRLKDKLREDVIVDSDIDKMVYSHDIAPIPEFMTSLFNMYPDVIVRPTSKEEIIEVIKIANETNTPVIPRGAATWGYGGAVPTIGGIVLDLTGLNRIKGLEDDVLTVEAGVIWKDIIEYLDDTDYRLKCYPSSGLSSTVGGWAATGGMGYGSLKYGKFVDNVKRVEVILPNGEIKEITPDSKDLTLKQVFGSEGILCIFTEINIDLRRKPEVEEPFVAYFNNTVDAAKTAYKLISETTPFSVIIKSTAFLRSQELERTESGAIMYGLYEGPQEEVERDMKIFKDIIDRYNGIKGDAEAAEREWEERFYPLRIKKWGPTVVTADILLPSKSVEDLIVYSWKLGKELRVDIDMEIMYVSKNEVVTFPLFLTDERRTSYIVHLSVAKKLIDYAIKNGGRSYGYGMWNAAIMGKSEPDRKRELTKLKRILDPKEILNPGKTIKLKSKYGITLPGSLYSIFLNMLWFIRKGVR